MIKAVWPFEKWPLEDRRSGLRKAVTPNLDDKLGKLAMFLPFLVGVFDSRVYHPLRILPESVLNGKLEKVDGFPNPIWCKYHHSPFSQSVKVNAHLFPQDFSDCA